MRHLLSHARSHAARLRVLALTPLAVFYLLAFDLVLKFGLSGVNDTRQQRLVAVTVTGLLWTLRICWGMKLKVDPRLEATLAEPGPTIVVANHHSPLDILVLSRVCRERAVHFVCRPGLDRGLPCISAVIRRHCVVLRAKARENLTLLRGLGQQVATRGAVAVIFPEGRKTIHTYPQLLPFRPGGLATLVAATPQARVVAVAIDGTQSAWPGPWRMPRPGVTVEATLAAVDQPAAAGDPRQVSSRCEAAIRRALRKGAAVGSYVNGDTWTLSHTL